VLVLTGEATVEPHVVFDVRNGPIMLAPGVEVRAFSRLVGPLAVARDTRIMGGQVSGSAIGPRCVVHGEVSTSVFLGYANKSHDGFLGHAVVGRWVNLGAGTINSNLKNTYGPVRVTLGGQRFETGLTFMGSLIGDHVKTAIGTMLPTGCVIGVGANLFGSTRPAPEVPPFAWGLDAPGTVLECGRFVEIAARVMPRRDVVVDDQTRRYLAAIWGAATRSTPCG
jgi:UDP-N-acetylglucosamine diphosphorylase/glucosamine-1-phosphate N-acetyltransferase